jgi:virginiamycin A acetyltransferase
MKCETRLARAASLARRRKAAPRPAVVAFVSSWRSTPCGYGSFEGGDGRLQGFTASARSSSFEGDRESRQGAQVVNRQPRSGRVPSGSGRRAVLRAAGFLGWLSSKPFVWSFRAASPIMGDGEAFRALSESVALIPGPLGIVVRRAVYRQVLTRVGEGVTVGFGTILAHRTIELGDHAYIGRYCLLGDVRVGDRALIADFVRVVSGTHGTDIGMSIRDQDTVYTTIHVGADCWLANGALVLASVGEGAVVGAGSVVTRDIADGVVVAGNPARTLRQRGE